MIPKNSVLSQMIPYNVIRCVITVMDIKSKHQIILNWLLTQIFWRSNHVYYQLPMIKPNLELSLDKDNQATILIYNYVCVYNATITLPYPIMGYIRLQNWLFGHHFFDLLWKMNIFKIFMETLCRYSFLITYDVGS